MSAMTIARATYIRDNCSLTPGPIKLCSDYLLYALETLRGNLFKKVGRSGHGTATLMSSEISDFKIPLPDLDVQKRNSCSSTEFRNQNRASQKEARFT